MPRHRGQIQRLDAEVEPDMFHGATLSAAEREPRLLRIAQVIRKGRVRPGSGSTRCY